jgi:hypothetical protein
MPEPTEVPFAFAVDPTLDEGDVSILIRRGSSAPELRHNIPVPKDGKIDELGGGLLVALAMMNVVAEDETAFFAAVRRVMGYISSAPSSALQ